MLAELKGQPEVFSLSLFSLFPPFPLLLLNEEQAPRRRRRSEHRRRRRLILGQFLVLQFINIGGRETLSLVPRRRRRRRKTRRRSACRRRPRCCRRCRRPRCCRCRRRRRPNGHGNRRRQHPQVLDRLLDRREPREPVAAAVLCPASAFVPSSASSDSLKPSSPEKRPGRQRPRHGRERFAGLRGEVELGLRRHSPSGEDDGRCWRCACFGFGG